MSNHSFTIPILSSIVIHAIIVIAIAAPMISPPDTDTGIETTLVSQEAFAKAQSALQAHHQQNQSAAQAQTKQISNADKALMNSHQQANNPYATNRVVNATASTPIGLTNSQNLQAAQTPPSAAAVDFWGNNPPTHAAELSDNTDFGQSQGESQVAPTKPSQEQINAAINAAKSRILSIWKTYPNQPNQAISFMVNLDADGNVVGVQFGGGHPELKESVEAAVRQAAPFSELAGLRNQLRFQFATEQLITSTEPNDSQ